MSGNRDRLPLTAAQTWVWSAQQVDPDNPVYKAAEYVDIQGRIDLELLQVAVRQAVDDADAIRVRFEADEDGPSQVVDESCDWPLPVVDLREALDPWAQAQEWMHADLERPLDLKRAPLFTIAVLRLADDRSGIYLGMHHILLDGFGLSLLLQRIAEVYTALEQGQGCPPSTLGSLRELVEDELRYRKSDQFTRDREYWLEQLSGMPEIVSPAGKGTAQSARSFLRETGQVSGAVADELRGLARQTRSSLSTVAMAALVLYVHRVTGASDLLLELVVSGRRGAVARTVPGMLTSAPPLRGQLHPEMTVAELVRSTAARARGALQHQRYPSMFLPEDLGLTEADAAPEPVAINIMGYNSKLQFGEHPVKLHNISNGSVENLTVNLYDRSDDGSLRIDFNANPALYDAEDNTAHHRDFLDLLHALAETEPERLVAQVARQPSASIATAVGG